MPEKNWAKNVKKNTLLNLALTHYFPSTTEKSKF